MRRTLALVTVALVGPLAAPAGGAYEVEPAAGSLTSSSGGEVVERDGNGGTWLFEPGAASIRPKLSLARLSRDGTGNDIGRATALPTELAHDDATGAVFYDDDGVIHRFHEIPNTRSTDTVVTTITGIRGMDVGPGSALHVATGERVERVRPDGTTEVVPGAATLPGLADVAVDADGSLVVLAEGRAWRVRDGMRSPLTAAGGCPASEACGDGGPASSGRLGDPSRVDLAADGTIYIGEASTHRVRVIGRDGRLGTITGRGPSCAERRTAGDSCGHGGPASSASIDAVTSLTVSGTDLFFVTRSAGAPGRLNRVARVATPAPVRRGYRLVAADGGVFTFGDASFRGSLGGTPLTSAVVAAAAGPTGYWLLRADGTVSGFGAPDKGSAAGMLRSPAAAIAPAPDGQGYLVVERSGRIHAFGASDPMPAVSVGDAVGAVGVGFGVRVAGRDGRVQSWGTSDQGRSWADRLGAPVVGIAGTLDGAGHLLVTSSGRVVAVGTARTYGDLIGHRLNRPIVGIVTTPTGRGYWLAASDGGIFSFGDARFLGSMGGRRLNSPIVAVLPA